MKNLLPALLAISLLAGCSKKENGMPLPSPVVADDARTILLKTVVEDGLPQQYKFVYNAANYVTEINYADGFSIYTSTYENKRIKKLTNTFTQSYLLYHYSNGMVSSINEFDSTHHKTEDYQLLYNGAGQLTELTRKNYRNDPAGVLYKKEKLRYHADSNLASIEVYYLTNGILKLTQTKQYSDYDNETNVDDFYKLHGFMETFLFLPQVKLQQNNPRKEIITSEVNTLEFTYSYEFTNALPVKKSGEMKQTRGPGNGQVFRFTHRYSYY